MQRHRGGEGIGCLRLRESIVVVAGQARSANGLGGRNLKFILRVPGSHRGIKRRDTTWLDFTAFNNNPSGHLQRSPGSGGGERGGRRTVRKGEERLGWGPSLV